MTLRRRSAWLRCAPVFAAFALPGCAIFAPTPPPPAPPPATISIARLYDQPAERAFINGVIPEPSAAILGSLGLLGLLRRRR